MLGFSPISSAPFSSLTGGVSFDSAVIEAASVSEVVLAKLDYQSLMSESAVSFETTAVSASVFSALTQEFTEASDAESAAATFISNVTESAQALDSVLSLATFQAVIDEAASILDVTSATADFAVSITEAVTGADTTSSLASLFASIIESSVIADILDLTTIQNVSINESSSGTDTVLSAAVLQGLISESLSANDAVVVAPSIFNAAVSEEVNAVAQFLVAVTFIATIQEGAQVADQLLARFLWELINDQQTVNWAGVNTAQSTAWGQVDASQSVTWNQIPTKL